MDFDDKLSSSRRNVVNALFDQVVTFRHAELKAARGSIYGAEAVHEEGYQVERGTDETLQFRRPDGRPLPDVPPPAAVPPDPAGAIRAQNAAQGLRLHARTGLAQWLGERLDVG